jgi:hypothetical protein
MFERRSTSNVHLSTGKSTILVGRVKKNAHLKRFMIDMPLWSSSSISSSASLSQHFSSNTFALATSLSYEGRSGKGHAKNLIVSYYSPNNPTRMRPTTMTKSTMAFGQDAAKIFFTNSHLSFPPCSFRSQRGH